MSEQEKVCCSSPFRRALLAVRCRVIYLLSGNQWAAVRCAAWGAPFPSFDGDIRVQEDGLSQAAYRAALPPDPLTAQALSTSLWWPLKVVK